MKKILIIMLALLPLLSMAQEEKKKKKKFSVKNLKIKKPNLRIGEKLGKLAGGLMTGKTDDLSETAPMVSMVSGVYDLRTKTSEAKYFPKGTTEGDYVAMITFMKQEGIGMLNVQGEVTCEGKPMEYVGLGSYAYRFDEPIVKPVTITIKSESGQEASFVIKPASEIEIISINDDPTLPIIDLTEDLKIKYTIPSQYDGSTINVGLLTDVAGARTFNFFADFKANKDEVTIPKEAFSNTEISGALNAGNFNKGNSYIVLERELVIEKSKMENAKGVDVFTSATIQAKSYATKPIIIKGKQENGIIANLEFSGGHKKTLGYHVQKPNARTGLPFSRASKFGLLSLSINGKTYNRETESGSSSYSVGNTRYTRTWTTTTTLEFPQLPDTYWDGVMEIFYQKMTAYFNNDLAVSFVPVENVTSAAGYETLFETSEANTFKAISRTYKNTKRASPRGIVEIFSNMSSSLSSENTATKMMESAGVDGLVTAEISFDIGANKEGKVVLLPTVRFNITGMDETKDNRQGTYANGYISYREGIPFNADLAKSDPDYLATVLNIDNIISCMGFMLNNLKAKEVQMGYDKIWSIGE